ncbi:hypothetical protein FSP39_018190 [Pinctada imbricata]|uniref:UspA domain-containing protein n=1 Tax=Pinctada imbricata TaxID=66713 RepID=A0AA88YDY2_PINIB|nr:hypothetical protein FSP39_018190 [Pinctada imbricata]
MRKLSVRWVPRLLTVDQKHTRRTSSRANLNLFETDPVNFLQRFVTMVETWVHHFTPEAKQQSKRWKHPSSTRPKKAKTVPSAGKVMASVFWDAEVYLNQVYKEGDMCYVISKGENKMTLPLKMSDEAFKEYTQKSQENIEKHETMKATFAQKLRDLNVKGEALVEYNPDFTPGEYIVKQSKEKNAAMIVIGSRGQGKIRRTILGSVSDYVVHHASCPVIVCTAEK